MPVGVTGERPSLRLRVRHRPGTNRFAAVQPGVSWQDSDDCVSSRPTRRGRGRRASADRGPGKYLL